MIYSEIIHKLSSSLKCLTERTGPPSILMIPVEGLKTQNGVVEQ